MTGTVFKQKKIVIASHNKGKIKEIRDLLKPLKIEILSTDNFNLKEPIEDGSSFEENALIKSTYVSQNNWNNLGSKLFEQNVHK